MYTLSSLSASLSMFITLSLSLLFSPSSTHSWSGRLFVLLTDSFRFLPFPHSILSVSIYSFKSYGKLLIETQTERDSWFLSNEFFNDYVWKFRTKYSGQQVAAALACWWINGRTQNRRLQLGVGDRAQDWEVWQDSDMGTGLHLYRTVWSFLHFRFDFYSILFLFEIKWFTPDSLRNGETLFHNCMRTHISFTTFSSYAIWKSSFFWLSTIF